MKRLVVIVVAIAAALVGSAVVDGLLNDDESAEERVAAYLAGDEAREFVSAEGRFRATYPGAPDRDVEDLDLDGSPRPLTTYVKDLGDAAFSVAYFDYPADAPFSLDGAVNGAAAAVEGKVEQATQLKVQNFDAVEFVVSTPDGLFVKQFMVRAGGRVYQVQVVGRDNPPKGYDEFKASFRIEG